MPALDAEILNAVRALNEYPKRGKDKTEDLLAQRIAKRWLHLLPSTKEELEALQKYGGGGAHSAVPALDAEILNAVRALNEYPKRGKDKTEDLLAQRITKRWLELLPSTREVEAFQTGDDEELQADMVQKLLEELRNFGRKPVLYLSLIHI